MDVLGKDVIINVGILRGKKGRVVAIEGNWIIIKTEKLKRELKYKKDDLTFSA